MYAVRRLATRDKNSSYKEDFVLYAFDENYDMKQVSVLDFLDGRRLRYMTIAVDKNQNLIMFTDWNDQVCICENTGKLKFQFKQHGSSLCSLSISNNNDIMVVSDDHRAVQVYSTEGNLKSTMKVPEDHEARRVAFHHGICKIFVLTCLETTFLLLARLLSSR